MSNPGPAPPGRGLLLHATDGETEAQRWTLLRVPVCLRLSQLQPGTRGRWPPHPGLPAGNRQSAGCTLLLLTESPRVLLTDVQGHPLPRHPPAHRLVRRPVRSLPSPLWDQEAADSGTCGLWLGMATGSPSGSLRGREESLVELGCPGCVPSLSG